MKLYKMKYKNMKGEEKLNCYYITLKKELIEKSRIDDTKEISVEVRKKEIIIREK